MGQELPPRLSDADYIDAQAELERLGPVDGVWVGTLRPILDPVGGYRDWPEGFPIRREISGEDVALWFIEKGDTLDPFLGDAIHLFAVDGTALVDYIAGNDAFNEVWSMSLNQIEPDRMKGFVLRTVHNFSMRKDSPWRIFPVYSVINLERER